MPAPNLDTIYAVEAAIIPAVAAVIGTATGIPTHSHYSTATKDTTPWAEVTFQLGAAGSHYGRTPGGRNYRDSWTGRLTITIVRNRKDAAQSAAVFTALGKIRKAFQIAQESLTEDNLPHHVIVTAIDSGTNCGVDEGNKMDVAEIVFVLTIGVRTTAWPADS